MGSKMLYLALSLILFTSGMVVNQFVYADPKIAALESNVVELEDAVKLSGSDELMQCERDLAMCKWSVGVRDKLFGWFVENCCEMCPDIEGC